MTIKEFHSIALSLKGTLTINEYRRLQQWYKPFYTYDGGNSYNKKYIHSDHVKYIYNNMVPDVIFKAV